MRQGFLRHVAHDHLRAGVTRLQAIRDRAGEFMRMGPPAAGAAQNKQDVLHGALLESVISRSLEKILRIKLLICTFHICTIQSKKTYLIADSMRSSEPWSIPESVSATSPCTFSTCRTPAAYRSLPSGVTTALTARRSSGSSTRRTSPSASRRSTSCVMFERTQVIFVAHSLKLSASPSLTRCDSAPHFAIHSPPSSNPPPTRLSH